FAPLLVANVPLLVRIVDDVVQLGRGTLDVMVARVGQRAQLAPAEVEARIERLAVNLTLRAGAALGEIDERDAGKTGWCFRADGTGDGGEDVDQLRGRGHAASGELPAGKFHDERNVQHLAVEQHAVLRLTMIAQSLAVI